MHTAQLKLVDTPAAEDADGSGPGDRSLCVLCLPLLRRWQTMSRPQIHIFCRLLSNRFITRLRQTVERQRKFRRFQRGLGTKVPRDPLPKAPRDPLPKPRDPLPKAPRDPLPKAPRDPLPKAPRDPLPKAPCDPLPKAPRDPLPKAPRDPLPKAPRDLLHNKSFSQLIHLHGCSPICMVDPFTWLTHLHG
jgi:hypothetical protein